MHRDQPSWWWRGFLILATYCTLFLASAHAQNPNVQDDFFSGRLRLQGDGLTFCTWDWAATREFDNRIAVAVADVLLLDVEVHAVEQSFELSGEELLQWIWVLLSDQCDLFLGFNLITGIYPSWLTPTRAYLDAGYVAVVKEEAYQDLTDVPRGSFIGSQLYTQADNELVVNLRSDPAWRRLPYDDPDMMIEHVESGLIEAGILFGPRFSRMERAGSIPIGLKAIPLNPALATISESVGGVAFARNAWIVSEFDAAIEVLIDTGYIAELIEELELQSRVPSSQ